MDNHKGNLCSEAASIGYEILGPMLLGYCMWLKEKAEEDNIDKIYFLSREGRILQEAFHILYPECRIPQYYLSVSRQSLLVPLLADVSDFDGLIETIKCCFHVPVLRMVRTVCLLDEERFKKGLAKIGLGEDTDIYSIPKGKKEAVYTLVNSLGEARFRKQKEYVERYLEEKDFTGNIALADIGWAGTMQNALNRYREGTDTTIHGYYFGVRNLEKDKYYEGIFRKGYLFEPGNHEDFDLMIRFTQGILELLFLNKTGSVQTYGIKHSRNEEKGFVVPVLAEAEYQGEEGELKREANQSVCKIFFLKKLFKVKFPYFRLLKWMVVKLDMKTQYRKRYFSQ